MVSAKYKSLGSSVKTLVLGFIGCTMSTETGGTHSFVALWANLSAQSEMEGFVEIDSFVPSCYLTRASV
jgi:hypothetical protein